MPLLPSALPPMGEARRYVANDFLNLTALSLRGRCLKGRIGHSRYERQKKEDVTWYTDPRSPSLFHILGKLFDRHFLQEALTDLLHEGELELPFLDMLAFCHIRSEDLGSDVCLRGER